MIIVPHFSYFFPATFLQLFITMPEILKHYDVGLFIFNSNPCVYLQQVTLCTVVRAVGNNSQCLEHVTHTLCTFVLSFGLNLVHPFHGWSC